MSNDLIKLDLSYCEELDDDLLVQILTTRVHKPNGDDDDGNDNGNNNTPPPLFKFGKLRQLILSSTGIGSGCITTIIQTLPELTHLDLSYNPEVNADDVLTALATSLLYLPADQQQQLWGDDGDDDDDYYLLQHRQYYHYYSPLPNLIDLNLRSCFISNQGLITLSQSQLLDQLEVLSLGDGSSIHRSDYDNLLLDATALFSNMKLIEINLDYDGIHLASQHHADMNRKHLADCVVKFS